MPRPDISLQDFFNGMAAAFRDQRWEAFHAVMRLPATIAIGRGRLHCETPEQVTNILRQYRENLVVDGYANSTATVLTVTPAPDGSHQVLLHWHHYNRQGARFHQVYASYFMTHTDTGAWIKTQVEFVEDVPHRLAAGLPIQAVPVSSA